MNSDPGVLHFETYIILLKTSKNREKTGRNALCDTCALAYIQITHFEVVFRQPQITTVVQLRIFAFTAM